jgi:GNAT superfamily N-acetyltransferase
LIPTADDLAQLDLDNEIELWTTAASLMPGGSSGRDGGVVWFASGLPVPFFNQVIATGHAADPVELARGIGQLRTLDTPYLVRLRSGIDDDAAPALERLGLREDDGEAYPAMALHPIPADVASGVPDDLEIRPVVDAAGLEDHITVLASGFSLPLDIARALVPVEELALPGFAPFVGYAEGGPVATSVGFTSQGTIGVYNVTTVEDARRHGYGAAVTRHAVADGAARGATVAILQSTTMGQPVYEAIGFREVVTFRVFVDDRSA